MALTSLPMQSEVYDLSCKRQSFKPSFAFLLLIIDSCWVVRPCQYVASREIESQYSQLLQQNES